ncbi:polysaccharide biosynthesis protein [Bacteroidia bacterium]|nr:polysaccharide biosynthesis protein [Bacteroidia bacterium]
MNLKFWILSLPVLFLFACQSTKDIAYLQDFDEYLQSNHSEENTNYEAKIRTNDHLLITVSAPVINQAQVAQFNLPMNTYLAPGETTFFQSAAIQTYKVDKNGDIQFPVVGQIHLAGMSRSEAVQFIKQKVSAYVPDPIVNLQFISFKVTVLGEVFRPGPVEVTDERISIFDALGVAGDLTIYGDRHKVILIRENDGKKDLHRIDLTQSSLFASPYYYLQQNDVVYVEPNKTKKRESKFGAGENYTMSILSVSFTAISVMATIYSIILNSKK